MALGLKERNKRGNVEWTFLVTAILAIIIAAVAPVMLASLILGRLQRSTTTGPL